MCGMTTKALEAIRIVPMTPVLSTSHFDLSVGSANVNSTPSSSSEGHSGGRPPAWGNRPARLDRGVGRNSGMSLVLRRVS